MLSTKHFCNEGSTLFLNKILSPLNDEIIPDKLDKYMWILSCSVRQDSYV